MSDIDKLAVAQRMFDAWDQLDWDTAIDLFADDGVLHSVMQEPLVGKEAIAGRLRQLASGATWIRLDVRTLGVLDGRVFAERVDRFTFNGHEGVVPVVGVLTITDGLVTEWLEYYDRATLLRGMGVGGE